MSQAISTKPEKKEVLPRRGQALAEFALTLPILLLLVFGIIEFARLFQTWVVLQSAARAGARAASIGMIDYEIFNVAPDAQPIDLRVLNSVIVCTEDDDRGAKVTHASGAVYYDGPEGLFATMYDGDDCDPTNEDHLQYRKDILRIFTVISEVRQTASTIAVYENRLDQDYDSITPEQAFEFVKGYWTEGYKNADNAGSPGWLSVEMCSTRPLLNGTSAAGSAVETRFATIRNSADAANAGGNMFGYRQPYCKLNEIPAAGAGGVPRPEALDNHGYRWFDVGGPGDRVTIFIKFNHPMITPLNLAQYIGLESRRSSVNESFRAPKAVGAFQRSIPPGRDPDENEPPLNPTETYTPSLTLSPVPTATRTHTETPSPFSCDNIELTWAANPFAGQEMRLDVFNGNIEQTQLTRARITWNAHPNWQLMYAQQFALDGSPHWFGTAPASTPQTTVDSQIHGTFNEGSFRFIGGGSSATWTSLFVNGPTSLFTAFSLNDFTAELVFLDPTNVPCSVLLTQENIPTPTPSFTATNGPTPTQEPICGSLSNIRPPTFGAFDSFDGSVSLVVNNIGQWPVYLLGFELVWPDPTHPDIGEPAGTYHLRRVLVGGNNTTDPQAVEVWRSSAVGQDAVGNTKTTIPPDIATRSTGSEGTWLTSAVLQPGNTRIWLDFDGFGGSLRQFGAASFHFNGSRLYIGHIPGCEEGNGQGLPPTAAVQATLPSPPPSNTPRPTNPPQPTLPPTTRAPTQVPTTVPTKLPTQVPTAVPTVPTAAWTQIGGLTPTGGAGGD